MSSESTSPPPGVGGVSEAFYVVGIGASAGGLEALEKLFDHMPPNTGMAFVIIQHLSPDFKSLMDELLARHTSMTIHRVEDGMVIQPNGVYLIPPRKNMALTHGRLLLTDQDQSGGLNMPIDIFFRSLAQDVGDRAVAVVLSGTGSDGSRGIQDVHAANGLVVVQDLESASFDGMPRCAEATGIADVTASPDKIPGKILAYIKHPSAFCRDTGLEPELVGETSLMSIFRLFRNRYGLDFTNYKPPTIQRRIDRRVQLTGSSGLAGYVERLQGDTAELDHLYRDLLVEVTQFFRDPQAFHRLRTEIIPNLVAHAESDDQIRLWVPGCATGEEAYSLAILLMESIEESHKRLDVKVFATDVHRNSLETASAGIYPANAMENIPKDLAAKYFVPHGELYHLIPAIRSMVICAPHDITNDPPFTKVDLISCRNVLIYLEPEIQQRVLAMFHFGLKVGGYLVLGPSETVGPLEREFATVEQHWRIYQKIRDVRLPEASRMPLTTSIRRIIPPRHAFLADDRRNPDPISQTVFDDLLDKYVPPSLLVNAQGDLVHTFGDARSLLVQPKGKPTLDILKMVRGDLRMALSTSLHRAAREKRTVVFEGVRVETNKETRFYKVIVEPYTKRHYDLFLISLEDIGLATRLEPSAEEFVAGEESSVRITQLERELDYTRESLQATVEEFETSNEELQATNEELVAANEELQSTNEELHSVNEELYTVNSEHQRKIDELTELTSDMDNLLRSTNIGTIFLDHDLRIRKFTPSITSAFNLMEQDVGRPIEHYAFNLDGADLASDLRMVLETGESREKQVTSRQQQTYLQCIHPYRTATGSVDGVVLTFTDVTKLEAIDECERQMANVQLANDELQNFVYAVSHDMRAPMRHIELLQGWIREETAQSLTPESVSRLQQLGEASNKLQRMFDCLLTYSRIYTRGAAIEPVAMEDVFQEVQNRITNQVIAAKASVVSDRLPIIHADARQMSELLFQLIDNAIKFNTAPEPQIHVQGEQQGEGWSLRVSDNGPGIPDDKRERAFTVFERLDAPDDLPGLGFGLALAKRIMERHGGEIRIESVATGGTSVVVGCED